MIQVEVEISVAEADQLRAIAQLEQETPSLRALPGNLGCRFLTDPKDVGAITLMHQWTDLGSLDAYRSGPLMAKLGAALRPLMTSAPSTLVYEAELIS